MSRGGLMTFWAVLTVSVVLIGRVNSSDLPPAKTFSGSVAMRVFLKEALLHFLVRSLADE